MKGTGLFHRLATAGRRLRPLQGYWIALVRFAIGVFFCITGATKLFDPGARQEMGTAARQRAESELTWDAVAARYRQGYLDTLGRTG